MAPVRLLMIDDEKPFFVLTRESLRETGESFQLEWAGGFDEGLAALCGGGYDACLLDYRLDNRDGLELLQQAIAAGCDAPIIMLTGIGRRETDLVALQSGAADYLRKDGLAPDTLARSVRYAIERHKVQKQLAQRSSELAASRARVVQIIESNADGVLIVDARGEIRFHNPAAAAMFGRADLLGSTLPFLLNQQGLTEVTIRPPERDPVAGEIRCTAIDWDDEPCHLVMLRDVTERKRAEQEMILAGEINKRLLPRSPPDLPGWELAGRCDPAASVGGDCFDFVPLQDGRWAVMIADVSGHGVASGLVMAGARAVVRTLAEVTGNAGETLTQANRMLHEDLGEGPFVAMMLLIVDPRTGRLEYAGAGHHGHVFAADGPARLVLRPTGPPLNVVGDVSFASQSIQLGPGELAFLYTDGLSEAHLRDQQFSTQRVLDHVADRHDQAAKTIIDTLFDAAFAFSDRSAQRDDMTAVVVKRAITSIAIAVVEDEGRFLIGQRPADVALGGLWEFPGGKVEPGESPTAAAMRECVEETGIAVEVLGPYPEQIHTYDHGTVRLRFFACRATTDVPPRPPFRWVARADLAQYAFPAGNAALLAHLATEPKTPAGP